MPIKTDMTEQQVKADIQWLEGRLAARDMKYQRSLNRFTANGQRRETIRELYNNPLSYFMTGVDTNTGILPAINIGRSMALTLQSKLTQTKGRIFFNPIKGLWETTKVARNAQIFFDTFIDRDQTMDHVSKAVLAGLVFDMGVIWIDEETKSTKVVRPWEFFVDPAEWHYSEKISRCSVRFEQYPLVNLKDKIQDNQILKSRLEQDLHAKSAVRYYWDLVNKKRWLFADGNVLVEVKDIDYDEIPFAIFFYNSPLKSFFSTSVMDNTTPNQRQIDKILRRLNDAVTFSPANTIFVPSTSTTSKGLELPKEMQNRIGEIVPIDMTLGQVVVSTPAPINEMYVELIKFFETESFNQEGVSQLSAQSKKPTGITSGVALDTLQDVESERFQAQVDNLIKFMQDIYTKMIKIFPKNDPILPKRVNRATLKWSSIVDQWDQISLSSSMASTLSKDPEVKLQQLEKLLAQGLINANAVAELMQLPDLEGAYSAATVSYDDCQKIIERVIEKDNYNFNPVVNLQMLLYESVSMYLQLDSVDEDPAILTKVSKLIELVTAKINDKNNIQNPAQPAPGPSKDVNVQDQALNGAQITGVIEVLKSVSDGSITYQQAIPLLSAAMPNLPIQQIEDMVGAPHQTPGQAPVNPAPTAALGAAGQQVTAPATAS